MCISINTSVNLTKKEEGVMSMALFLFNDISLSSNSVINFWLRRDINLRFFLDMALRSWKTFCLFYLKIFPTDQDLILDDLKCPAQINTENIIPEHLVMITRAPMTRELGRKMEASSLGDDCPHPDCLGTLMLGRLGWDLTYYLVCSESHFHHRRAKSSEVF